MSAIETPVHFVTVKRTRDADGDIDTTSVTFECRGDRTSPCHIYPACECESWSDEHDQEHPRVPHDECWAEGWFDNGCAESCYDGGDGFNYGEHDIPEGSGPIEFEWDECILWRWADEATR